MKPDADELVAKARTIASRIPHIHHDYVVRCIRGLADTLEESQRELQQVKGEVSCPDCSGLGKTWAELICPTCKGSGKKYNAEKAKGEK